VVDGVLEARVMNVTTLRTVFGARPASSIAAATVSTSATVTRSTGLSPTRGEMWTHCIDSQFCR